VDLAVSPYELQARAAIGRSAAAVRRGALLRFTFPEWGFGYADCHPWPELGDAPLAAQLETLARGGFTRLTERSFGQARVDAQARSAARSAFVEFDTSAGIRSHALAGNAADLSLKELDRLRRGGFALVKVKAGRDVERDAPALASLARAARERRMKLRVDLNASPSTADAHALLDALAAEPGGVDFIEDPTRFDAELWSALKSRYPFRLALDMAAGALPSFIPDCVDVLVLKPAIQDATAIVHQTVRPGLDFVVTTYLDHPVGSTGAAWHAFRIEQLSSDRLEVCGLMTHMNYEPNAFTRACRTESDRWRPPAGTGMGFDEELAACAWSALA
jgi:O-succinylbenzoate synthase